MLTQQLRVCSGHFHGGEKREGDVPVADPDVDPPVKVELPPPSPKSRKEKPAKRLKSDHHNHHNTHSNHVVVSTTTAQVNGHHQPLSNGDSHHLPTPPGSGVVSEPYIDLNGYSGSGHCHSDSSCSPTSTTAATNSECIEDVVVDASVLLLLLMHVQLSLLLLLQYNT